MRSENRSTEKKYGDIYIPFIYPIWDIYIPFVFGNRCLKSSLDKKAATNNTLIYYSGNTLLSLKSDDIKLNQLPVLL